VAAIHSPDLLAVGEDSAVITPADITDELARMRPHARDEYERFQHVQQRRLSVTPPELDAALRDATVIVTGGTGCIGTVLLQELRGYKPARIISIARGVSRARAVVPGVEYRAIDIRDTTSIRRLFAAAQPDLVFHLAAIRDPGWAQAHPRETITTNVYGTGVVLDAAVAARARRFIYASTGKAMRFYTRDTYAATKMIGEAIVAGAGAKIGIGAARFTHVVDNSIVVAKLKTWMSQDFMYLHDRDIAFYAQSAIESAQLLLLGALAEPGEPRLHCLRDLDHYFELLDLALGMRQATSSESAITFTGFPPGYRSTLHPGQYSPTTLDEIGPLFNAIEADTAFPVLDGSVVALTMDPTPDRALTAHAAAMANAARPGTSIEEAIAILDQAVRELFARRLSRARPSRLRELARVTSKRCNRGDDETTVIDELILRTHQTVESFVR
jgi:hypothetical protein